jgi:alpha-galactosidase
MENWIPPILPEQIPHGDMPGDKVSIGPKHIEKANKLFPVLQKMVAGIRTQTNQKVVLSVYGGSGVGKSETASILSYYFSQAGIGSYTLSGDNYPRRIPKYNDAERLRIFREEGLGEMLRRGSYSLLRCGQIREWQREGTDGDRRHQEQYPWFEDYLLGGTKGLEQYLGTEQEINFAELSAILKQFKEGASDLWLRRLGREEDALWYEQVSVSDIQVLVVEWTHGNNEALQGVDIPVYLYSTPEETLAHRMARARDGAVDSPFTEVVLGIEQRLLASQRDRAVVVLSQEGVDAV